MSKSYEFSIELSNMAHALYHRYSMYFLGMNLHNIYFAFIDGKPPKRAPVVEINGINGAWAKQQLEIYEDTKLYCIAVWKESWDELFDNYKEWMLFEAMMYISDRNDGSLKKPDVVGFGPIIEYLGPYWKERADLPSLINSKKPIQLPFPRVLINNDYDEY